MRDSIPRTVLMTADTVGGVWTYALELSQGLTARGIDVILATMGEPVSPTQQTEAAAIQGLRVVESSYKLEWMQDPWEDVDAAGQWLLELEQEFTPDLIHLNGYAHGALPWRAPTLVIGHSCVLSWWKAVKGEAAPEAWETYRQRVSAGLQNATMVAAPTEAMLNTLVEHYGPLRDFRVLYNGRSQGLFQPGALKQPLIFAAGRLGDEAKNIHALGRAAEGLPWPIFVAGADRDSSGDQTLPGNITHLGKLPPETVADWMAMASIYCMPARYEPFGLSILEAALSGCTLVLGDIPTLRELWENCAYFVPPDNPSAIRGAIYELIADSDSRRTLAAAARERALHFSHDRFIERYIESYRHLITAHRRRHSLAA